MNFSQTILAGHLTRDPEIKFFKNGGCVTEFGLAVNRPPYTNDADEVIEEVDFFDCKAFSKVGENIEKFFSKGKPIFVTGVLMQERWETDEGDNRSRVIIKVLRFNFVGPREDGDSPPSTASSSKQSSEPIEDEDIPF